jgi:flagellum-specific peptidoglycan hydrolase FlgJ
MAATRQEQLAFIEHVAAAAQASQAKWAVPASITIAQAACESGWGKSELAMRDCNFFGIKARQGESYEEFTTKECVKQDVVYVTKAGDTAAGIAKKTGAALEEVLVAVGASITGDPLPGGKQLRLVKVSSIDARAKFAKYESAEEGFDAHGKLLATLNRYRPAMAKSDDAIAFAIELQHCGYSTNLRYPSLLASLINQFNLTRFDAMPRTKSASA